MKNNLLFIIFPQLGILIIFSAIITGCSGIPEKNTRDQSRQVSDTQFIPKPPSSFNDSLMITDAAAIFYNSDSLQLEGFKAINKKMVFESMVHECFYQMKNARMVLKKYWPRLKIIDTSKARYLVFLKTDQSKAVIDLNTKNDMCGLFMFDGEKDPVLADMTNIETALRFYFEE